MASRCKFCEIVAGALPADVVFEDEASVAFLDARPLFPGHCLLVPRRHFETLPELPADLAGPLFRNTALLARAVETGLGAEGSFVGINNRVSQSIPHLHIHVVPRRRKDGLRGFFWPRQTYRDRAEVERIVSALKAAIAQLIVKGEIRPPDELEASKPCG